MTKFQNPSFNSPANNKNYNENYNRTFGKRCEKEDCDGYALDGTTMCREHLENAGIIEMQNPETD